MPVEVVAQQLGHADTTMAVKVYGRFKPAEEITGWERIAAERAIISVVEADALAARKIAETDCRGDCNDFE